MNFIKLLLLTLCIVVGVEGRQINYRVSVKTGDVSGAGTNANVYIQFIGSKGKTKPIKMDDARNNFEKGKVEHFDLRAVDVGPLTSIIVGHDNTGSRPGWYLEDVTVRKSYTREVFDRDGKILKIPEYDEYYHFICKKWLATDEGDGMISRELLVDKKKKIVINQ